MLKKIITESDLGIVTGEATSGADSLAPILAIQPDLVLIDLLMPELDGIETMEQLRAEGFQGQFIMISQVVNKEMVGEAYTKGVEFFIHKPINRIEVQSILKKAAEQYRLKQSLLTIQESLASLAFSQTPKKPASIREMVLSTLGHMGIAGETGSNDMIAIIEWLVTQYHGGSQLPPLKDLYEMAAMKAAPHQADIKKESKAIEQRIRRTILAAIHHLASLGAVDYTNPDFEYYAPRYFDFQEIRNYMKNLEDGRSESSKVKVNIKKFLQVLYLEIKERYHAAY
ncbi:Two-component response regulator, controling glutamine utilization [Bacillus thermotolerans]|nr:Two-component response regulator, controling glutamine utilization [Bacillus thermotolerans]